MQLFAHVNCLGVTTCCEQHCPCHSIWLQPLLSHLTEQLECFIQLPMLGKCRQHCIPCHYVTHGRWDALEHMMCIIKAATLGIHADQCCCNFNVISQFATTVDEICNMSRLS